MLEPFRSDFNSRFSADRYQGLLGELSAKTGVSIDFRVCETPCFFAKELLEEMAAVGRELTDSLVGNSEYMAASAAAVPEAYRVPNLGPHPHFMTVDFGFARRPDGTLGFKLVELQAFPSIFGYQDMLSRQYIESYGLPPGLGWLLGGHDDRSYWEILREVIVGRHEPENVVLLEVTPERQKTRVDFRVHEQRLGIKTVDISTVERSGRKLFYRSEGRSVPIERIYNRAIVDEIVREKIKPGFDYRDDLDVEWAGNPNWYFQISKFSLPYLAHPAVPKAVFLNDWMEGRRRNDLPESRQDLLLKPLYSFAGKGIQFAPTDADLAAIPVRERHLYLLQERISFTPVIQTPPGLTQAEVRVMYVWPDGGEMQPVISLVRLGRGLMMGVDHNRNQDWVGGSAALYPQQ